MGFKNNLILHNTDIPPKPATIFFVYLLYESMPPWV